MFHVPAHKFVGGDAPAQAPITFIARSDKGRRRGEIAYQPLVVVICGRRYDLALHHEGLSSAWCVSDPVSGRLVTRFCHDRGNLLEQAADQVRRYAMTISDEVFEERFGRRSLLQAEVAA